MRSNWPSWQSAFSEGTGASRTTTPYVHLIESAHCGLKCWNGAESLLGHLHHFGSHRRFRPATVVGAGGDDSDWPGKLVAGVSQRLVLIGCSGDWAASACYRSDNFRHL